MTPSTKLQRWLDLIAYLVGHRVPVTAEQIMEHVPAYAEKLATGEDRDFEAARRMFERDKTELKQAGIPLRTVEYHVDYGLTQLQGYQINRRDFYLPYLKLLGSERPDPGRRAGAATLEIQDDDASLALEALRRVADVPSFPLRDEARSAFRKLAFDIDPDAFSDDPVVFFAQPPRTAELDGVLRRLSDALLERRRVAFTYHGITRGDTTEREVAPWGLLFQHSQWYLIGHDSLRDGVRVFRASRMEGLRPAKGDAPMYEIPPDFRLDDYIGRDAWELGEAASPETVRVRFRFPASLWAARNRKGTFVSRDEDGSEVREFIVHQPDAFLRWVLGQANEAKIVSPEWLEEQRVAVMRKVVEMHDGGRFDD
jgi:predicted DNA-binding transcriptional regulator YafY